MVSVSAFPACARAPRLGCGWAADARARVGGWGDPVSGSLGSEGPTCAYRCTTPLPILSVGDAIGVEARTVVTS